MWKNVCRAAELGTVMPSLFIFSRCSFGESVSVMKTAYDWVPRGPFVHEMDGLMSGPGPM